MPTAPPKSSEEASLEHNEWDWLRGLLGQTCCHPGCPAPPPYPGGGLEGCSCLTKASWWSLQKDPLENLKLGDSLMPEKSEQPVDWGLTPTEESDSQEGDSLPECSARSCL